MKKGEPQRHKEQKEEVTDSKERADILSNVVMGAVIEAHRMPLAFLCVLRVFVV
jgi:hypothetical protein